MYVTCVCFLWQKGNENTVMEEAGEEPKKQLPVDMYYNYEELHSKPFVTTDSKISENLLYLWYLTNYYNYYNNLAHYSYCHYSCYQSTVKYIQWNKFSIFIWSKTNLTCVLCSVTPLGMTVDVGRTYSC